MNTFTVVKLNDNTRYLLDNLIWIHASYVPHIGYVCSVDHCWMDGYYYDCAITYTHLVDSELLCYLTLLDCCKTIDASNVSYDVLQQLHLVGVV